MVDRERLTTLSERLKIDNLWWMHVLESQQLQRAFLGEPAAASGPGFMPCMWKAINQLYKIVKCSNCMRGRKIQVSTDVNHNLSTITLQSITLQLTTTFTILRRGKASRNALNA